MSHITVLDNPNPLLGIQITIGNYVTGGEAVSPSEIGAASVDLVVLGTVHAGQNSLGVPLFPMLNGGKIQLFRFVSGSPVEIPATNNLNAVIPGIVHVSGNGYS